MKFVYATGSFFLFVSSLALAQTAKPAIDPGVRPVGANGKPLNLDFETGTLDDWTADGNAFVGQPVKGDTVNPRRSDMHSGHQGDFWIGTFERKGDKPQGTLTSAPFRVTHPWATFLVGGGSHPSTTVELVDKETDQVISRTSGRDEEDMHRVSIDLRPFRKREIFIRLVDKNSGGWGHINFDDFRFHEKKPDIPSQIAQPQAALDAYKFAGLPPERSASVMTVPEGFEVKLFAGEPDVRQPIAFCLDDRGRLWVAEAYCYPRRRPDKDANDRILIFEDVDGDGHFDKRTVFMEGLNLVSGLEVGFGGVWIGAAPYLMFVPVKPGEDKPAGPPKILLDGWAWQDTHETVNTFTWGPDGWLYGCHGVFTHSRVGKPGTPDNDRIPINAGVWRYHPTRHDFEVFAQGTSNPWGLDFNEMGQAFVEACVIPHCFHIIQGGRYYRQAGQHFNPFTYVDIRTIADHLHFVGVWNQPHAGNNRSSSVGGGHAHCGLMCYQGGLWPDKYRGQLFMGNIHGRRINIDLLKPQGSGYLASHGPDFLLANDAWARFINMRYGPDGNAYLIDWYDQQACHRNDPEIWDRSNGRIYKVGLKDSKPVTGVDLQAKTDVELAALQREPNAWYVRHARRLLQERAQDHRLDKGVVDALSDLAFHHAEESQRLRGLWALHDVGELNEEGVQRALADKEPHMRAWAIQLAAEKGSLAPALVSKLEEMAVSDPSPVVRLYLASACERIPTKHVWKILAGLTSHAEDAQDHNLPCMYWYAAEPLGGIDPARALELAMHSKVPILQYMVRRIGTSAKPDALTLIIESLGKANDRTIERTILAGLVQALQGRRSVAMPSGWPAALQRLSSDPDTQVRNQALTLAVTFGDRSAFALLRELVSDPKADVGMRQRSLVALLSAGDKELPGILQKLVSDPALRGPALRGLASYDDSKTPEVVLQSYAVMSTSEKRDAVATLASRVSYARALLDAVGAKRVPAADIPADLLRQLTNLHNNDLDKQIAEVWGVVRTTPADRLREIDRYRKIVRAPYQPARDLSHGRALFAKTCQQCHTLFGQGGKIGPDITGSNRANLDYILENILDPSAVIPKEYAVTIFELKNGRVVTGILKEQTPAAYTIATSTEILTLPKSDVASTTPTNISLMPEGQLKPFSDDDVRSLIAYLQNPSQVPVLATTENAKDLFNGKDLTGWDGNMSLWRVENGEIVGKSPGIKRNEFLKSQMVADDFRLDLKMKLTPNTENSGVQFRSEVLPDGLVRGYQADAGLGWWGKLYEEHGRAILWNKPGDPHVKVNDWNDYRIEAQGNHIRTFLNGKPCVDIEDPKGALRGIFALQIHSGGPMEVRFKDIKLEVLPKKK